MKGKKIVTNSEEKLCNKKINKQKVKRKLIINENWKVINEIYNKSEKEIVKRDMTRVKL